MSKISVIIPCRNESRHVAATLDSLLAQEHEPHDMEILVADGLSDDGTRDILADYEKRHASLRVIDNPEQATPAALRILLAEAKGDFIIRFDAHAVCPSNYVATLVKVLETEEADNVGAVWVTEAHYHNLQAEAIAVCLNSPFGVGASYRTLGGSTPIEVETVPFGAWRADHFKKFGSFDERFTRAQDLEHNVRVRQMGGKILCLPWLVLTYIGRDTFDKLRRMAFQYGYWKIPVREKHHVKFSLRQYIPPLMVVALLGALPLTLVNPLFAVVPASYLILNAMFSLIEAVNHSNALYFPLCLYGFFILHVYYGVGYLRGIWDTRVAKKWQFTESSR